MASHLPSLKRNRFFRFLYRPTILPRARKKVATILPHLEENRRILDIGSGNGGVGFLLKERGCDIECCDIADSSYFESVPITVFQSGQLPYSDNQFDTGLLLTVLHHTAHPEAVLQEANRVCRQLIIIEDIYTSKTHKYLTFKMDSLVNWEWKGHPHSNKTDLEWESALKNLGLTLLHKEKMKVLGYFQQRLYIVS